MIYAYIIYLFGIGILFGATLGSRAGRGKCNSLGIVIATAILSVMWPISLPIAIVIAIRDLRRERKNESGSH